MSVFPGLRRSLMFLLLGPMRLLVRPAIAPEDVRTRLGGRSRLTLYVQEERSFSDAVAITIACRSQGLRHPLKRMRSGDFSLAQSMVELERPRGVLRKRPDRRQPPKLGRAVAAVTARTDLDIDVVPVAVYWGRSPHRVHSIWDLMLSEDWALVGPFRRLISVLFRGRRTVIRFGEPRSLRALAAEGQDPARIARRLLKDLRAEFRHMRVETIGPELAPRAAIVAQVLRTRAVRTAVRALMREKNQGRREAVRAARALAMEIAADYSPEVVRLYSVVLKRVWNRLYDGVDMRHAERLDALPAGCELVYVPCHRSHMDYLLLSYTIYQRNYVVPHIAAGINLNLPVVGRVLRMGGAFFLRRSFRGSSLYPVVFTKYVDVMMNRGHPIEFFIEGGRSRTGRLLAPKTGMLAMTMRSFLRDPRRPVVYVPVYFGYERIVEAKTYVGELSGRPKEQESMRDLVRAARVLRQRFGQVHVCFGEPLPLASSLDGVNPGWRDEPLSEDARPAWFGAAVDRVADEIMTRINAAAVVTPVNLLALTLLAMPRQAMIEADLVRQLDLYSALLLRLPYSPGMEAPTQAGGAMIAYGETMGILERHRHPLGDVLRMNEENAILTAYYRNNVIHVFALPSLIACAFLNNAAMRGEGIQRLAARIYPYARQELFLRWSEDELPGVVREILEGFAAIGLLERAPDDLWLRPATGSKEAVQLSVLAQGTIQMIERYYLAIALLLKAGRMALTQEQLETRCVNMASRMALLYELNSPEFFDKPMFRAFIDLLRERDVVRAGAGNKLDFDDALGEVALDAQVVLSEQIRHSILQVTHFE
jgi:glycerol-3-phosphate O-acyltransferase